MKYFINYSDKFYIESQKLSIRHAENFGFISTAYKFTDIDQEFVNKNSKILSSERGAGYWLWKPYIILKKLNELQYNDYLIYMDSGAYLTKPVDDLLSSIDERGILCFQLKNQKNNKWIKGDCFFTVNNLNETYKFKDDEQILASFIFFKKTNFCVDFIKKWLFYSQNENILTDIPNLYKENCLEFNDHRHDQAIFSLMCYNYNISCIPDISQWGKLHGVSDDYVRINHHRNRDY